MSTSSQIQYTVSGTGSQLKIRNRNVIQRDIFMSSSLVCPVCVKHWWKYPSHTFPANKIFNIVLLFKCAGVYGWMQYKGKNVVEIKMTYNYRAFNRLKIIKTVIKWKCSTITICQARFQQFYMLFTFCPLPLRMHFSRAETSRKKSHRRFDIEGRHIRFCQIVLINLFKAKLFSPGKPYIYMCVRHSSIWFFGGSQTESKRKKCHGKPTRVIQQKKVMRKKNWG